MAWPEIIPYIRYEDPTTMIDWLGSAFGFEKHTAYEDDGQIVHAEVSYGTGMFMVGPTREGDPESAQTPNQLGGRATGGMYVIVDDPDAHCERARAAGAEITRGPANMEYGPRGDPPRAPHGPPSSLRTHPPG